MYVIRNTLAIAPALQQAVVTIGNFDGVHVGHQALLSALKARARVLQRPTGVIIFEPQPQEFFSVHPPPRLSTFRQKYYLIKQQDIDFIMVLRFNAHWAQLTAKDFICQVLWQQLQIAELLTGGDFRFGRDRRGDISLLRAVGQQYGFDVHLFADVGSADGQLSAERISSTQIRNLLALGQMQAARALLGRFFSLSGKVIRGAARGRTLNMPTANIALAHRSPVQGIFVVRVQLDKQYYPAVASVGTRPVFNGVEPMLEVHLLDFNADLYGKHLCVEFLHRLRDEINFSSVELLRTQMQQDLCAAKNYFKEHDDEL